MAMSVRDRVVTGKYNTCTAGAAAGHDEVAKDTRIKLPVEPLFPLP